MLYATISADIVDSTKMTVEDTIRVNKLLTDFLDSMKKTSERNLNRYSVFAIVIVSRVGSVLGMERTCFANRNVLNFAQFIQKLC